MESIKRILEYVNDNWATIVTIAVLAYGIYRKAKKAIYNWQVMTEEQREEEIKKAEEKAIKAAKNALGAYIMSLVAKAEIEWNDKGSKMGPVKRAEVIEKIFKEYPILTTVSDQAELLAYIDELINEALKTVRETVRKETE